MNASNKYTVTLKSGTRFEPFTMAEDEVSAIRAQKFVRDTDSVKFERTLKTGNLYTVETSGKYVTGVIPVLVAKVE